MHRQYYKTGNLSCLIDLGLSKRAADIVPYDPVYAAQQTKHLRPDKILAPSGGSSVPRYGPIKQLWRKLPPALRAGLTVGAATAAGGAALTGGLDYSMQPKKTEHFPTESVVAGTALGLPFGLSAGVQRHGLGKGLKTLDRGINQWLKDPKFIRRGFDFVPPSWRDAVDEAIRLDPKRTYRGGDSFSFFGDNNVKEIPISELRQGLINELSSLKFDSKFQTAQSSAARSAANDVAQAVMQGMKGAPFASKSLGMAGGLPDAELTQYISSIIKDNPNANLKQLRTILHPDKVMHNPAIDKNLAARAYKALPQFLEQGSNKDEFGAGLHAFGLKKRQQVETTGEKLREGMNDTFPDVFELERQANDF